MTALYVAKFVWSGLPGGTGLSQFAIDATDTASIPPCITALRSFFNTVMAAVPPVVSVQEQGDLDQYEHTTATLIGSTSITPGASIAGRGGTAFAAAAGGMVHWLTNAIQNGHRVRGRTFIVPFSTTMYDTNGTLVAAAVSTLTDAAQGLVTYNSGAADGRLAIWGRPVAAKAATATKPAVNARAASLGYISGFKVPDQSAVLRGRRQ